jgi:hypothetical protein
LPARRIAAVEAALVTAGAGLAARSASTAARLRCTVRGYAACAAVQVGSAGPRQAWPQGHEPDADQRVEAQAQAVCTFLRTICR